MKFNIIIAVWGREYISSLCDITLPSLALRGDKATNCFDHEWKFLIYTPSTDNPNIRSAVAHFFPEANCFLEELDPSRFENHYLAMASAHHRGVLQSKIDSARAIIIPPDAVFASGSLAYIVKMSGEGKRAIMTMGPRIRQKSASLPLSEIFAKGEQLTNRELVKFLNIHIHPAMLRYNWSSKNFSSLPFTIMWDAPGGWLCRAFHLHPIMIDCSTSKAISILKKDTIDGEFIGNSIGNWDYIHVIQDSDEFIMCTLTEDDVYYSNDSFSSASAEIIHETAYRVAIVNPIHRWYLTKSIKIHFDQLSEDWIGIEEESGHIVFSALSAPAQITAMAEMDNKSLEARCIDLENQLLISHERNQALRIVLGAIVNSIKPRALDRRRFQSIVAAAGRETPDQGPASARHQVLLEEARRILFRK